MSGGCGESGPVGKQSGLDRRHDEHSQPHDSVGTGDGVAMGPVRVARGGEGSWAGRAGYGVVEGPAVGNLVCSGASTYRCPGAFEPKP